MSPYLLTFLITFGISLVSVPIVIKFAERIGAVDIPNGRKVHKKPIPRIGGVAIYIAFIIGYFYVSTQFKVNYNLLIATTIIVITGFLDDKFQIKPWQKLVGQTLAATFILADGHIIKYITVPFVHESLSVNIGLAYFISLFWILGVTNSVNLIDGLDGLASGVSIIAAGSIMIMALITGEKEVALVSLALIGATLGFLFFNFHPAKIFMGDTGSLLLGFLLSILSMIGFKQVTFITFIIPILILAVPLIDTTMAIIRRKLQNKKIMDADKSHLHHRLLDAGYTHTQSVLFIYMISGFFGAVAIFLYKANLLTSIIIFILVVILVELLVEVFELIGKNYKPLINLYKHSKKTSLDSKRLM